MKRNFRPRRSARASTPDPSAALRESAQKIWLAGLGALERARTDGPRVFESLVEQGRNMGARAVGAADEALKAMRQADYSGTHLEKLNQAVEERLTRSLGKLGVLSGKEVEDLSRQVRELSESMRRFMSAAAGPAGATAGGTKAPGTRARRPTGASAKAARRRKAPASAKATAATRSPATRVKKAAARKPRKSSRAPRAKP